MNSLGQSEYVICFTSISVILYSIINQAHVTYCFKVYSYASVPCQFFHKVIEFKKFRKMLSSLIIAGQAWRRSFCHHLWNQLARIQQFSLVLGFKLNKQYQESTHAAAFAQLFPKTKDQQSQMCCPSSCLRINH